MAQSAFSIDLQFEAFAGEFLAIGNGAVRVRDKLGIIGISPGLVAIGSTIIELYPARDSPGRVTHGEAAGRHLDATPVPIKGIG